MVVSGLGGNVRSDGKGLGTPALEEIKVNADARSCGVYFPWGDGHQQNWKPLVWCFCFVTNLDSWTLCVSCSVASNSFGTPSSRPR